MQAAHDWTKQIVKAPLSLLAQGFRLLAGNAGLRQLVFNAIRLERPEISGLQERRDIRFLAYLFAHRREGRGQILQDLWVTFELEEKRNGFFVEFGATDGMTNSNSYLLETRYGWNGIVAEPNPHWHERLARNRTCAIEHRCVSSRSNERVRFLTTDDTDPELSAIAEFSDGDHFSDVRQRAAAIDIETISLNDLLETHRAPFEIDYLSVDTEGSEYDILSSFDFSRHSIRLMSVELNEKTKGAIETLLVAKGFDRVFPEFSQWDGWFVRRPNHAG